MPNPIIILYVIGFAGIIAGIYTFRSNRKLFTTVDKPKHWKAIRTSTLVLGILLGAATWPLTYWMGYPLTTPDGIGRVAGFPFFVAYFDSAGRDYVGPLTMPGVIANIIFWAFVPQIVLNVWGRLWLKKKIA